jgi:hypothetical protein
VLKSECGGDAPSPGSQLRCSPPSPRKWGEERREELAASIAVSFSRATKGDTVMVIGIAHLQPIVAIIAGILILIIPRLLNIIVAVYLIVFGILGLGLFK